MTTGEIINEIKELEKILRDKAKMETTSEHQCGMADAYNVSADIVEYLIEHIDNSFKNFYFTFGSWEGFPYQNTYLIVKANLLGEAIRKFNQKYPNENENIVLCSFYYTEEEWNEQDIARCYIGQNPAEIIY